MATTNNNVPITVSQLNDEIKHTLDSNFEFVYVTGEISNFKRVFPSGHCYFVLKDEASQISCNLWNFRFEQININIVDGITVNIKGRIKVYSPRGTYSIDIFEIENAGLGSLQTAFEKLKKKLAKEGLFDEKFKNPIPLFPETIAIITSETGAVIEDFKKIASRRYPLVKILLFPSLVQGAGSSDSICKSLRSVNNYKPEPDIIVIARGGGSIEDLWSFNEEKVARAVFNSKIPVVSAVGHETDYTICDFVSDLRAPTPSAAAEMILPDKNDLLERIEQIRYYLILTINNRLVTLKKSLENISKNYSFKRPKDILLTHKIKLDDYTNYLKKLLSDYIWNLKKKIEYDERILENISPQKILRRGYSFVEKEGKIVVSEKELETDDIVSINFYDGKKNANIID